jgi:hypothetical protein
LIENQNFEKLGESKKDRESERKGLVFSGREARELPRFLVRGRGSWHCRLDPYNGLPWWLLALCGCAACS